jgi:uncharacterized integral membrane protein (TIGR00698 family)
MSFAKENRVHTLNGLLFVLLFALSSMYLAQFPWVIKSGINSLVIAIVLGIIYGNTLRHELPKKWTPGIQFAAKRVLRLAIILYGFRITFQEIASVGLEGLIIDAVVVTSTLVVGSFIGIKIFKLDRHIAILVSTGAAICGAAAVLAAEDVLKSEPYKAAVAIGTVVLFGTTAMFLYPMLQNTGLFGFSVNQYGIFAGASVHEVAQALVAGSNVSPETGNVAVIVKMTRVLMLVPVLIFLSIYEVRITQGSGNTKTKIMIPWFAVIFMLMIGVNSLELLSPSFVTFINQFDLFLLTMAMAAIGIETNLKKIKQVGVAPLYLAIFLFLWLTAGVYTLVRFLVT